MAERETWIESLSALGAALLDLVRAEIKAALSDIKVFFRQVAMLLAVGGLLLLILIYIPFILLLSAIDGIHAMTDWPYWGSALLLFGLVILLMATIAAVAYFLIGRHMRSPVEVFQNRLDDHKGWWRNDVLDEPRRLDDRETSLSS